MSHRNYYEEDDFNSWETPNRGGFFKKLKRSYQRWKLNRQMIAEERRSIQEMQAGNMRSQSVSHQPLQQDSAQKEQSFDNEHDKVITKSDISGFEHKSFFQSWREERKLRRQLYSEKRIASNQFDPLLKRSGTSRQHQDEFGVGNQSSTSAETGNGNSGLLRMTSDLGRILWSKRIPQWALAAMPALFFLFAIIIPSQAELNNRFVDHTKKLETGLYEKIQNKDWDAARLICLRLMSSNLANLDDIFDYREILVQMGKEQESWAFLKAKQDSINALDKGSFHFRYASLLLDTKPSPQIIINEVVPHLKDAISGKLEVRDEIRARQYLSRIYAFNGDLANAAKVLEPVQSNDVTVAADALWIRANIDSTSGLFNLQSIAERLLREVENQISQNPVPTPEEIGAKVRLLMLLNREPELRQWIAGLGDLANEDKTRWSEEVDRISLTSEVRRTPINYERVWVKLLPFLEKDQNNLLWNEIAASFWALPEEKRFDEAYQWVDRRIRGENVQPTFLRQAALAAHINAQWDQAKYAYEKILEVDPKDVSALNNLAGIYYKFPPYNLPKALQLINQAIEATTQQSPALLETKGQILARMGKTEESRQILERCLVNFPNEWNLHNTLAQIYESEGQISRARAHRERLEKLKKPSNAPLENTISFNKTQIAPEG